MIAPASAPPDPNVLPEGIAALERHGYRIECPRTVFENYGYLSATDETRLAELNHYLGRPDIRAIFCVRGGYGILRLLAGVDYEAARKHPKLIIGYSDVTALHLALFEKSGLPGLSGPMVAVEWPDLDAYTGRIFQDVLTGTYPLDIINPADMPFRTLREGSHDGLLMGGNLTLISRLIGTPYLPDLTGAILFLEEVGEPPYRIDGLLAHLKLAGILDRLGGLMIGGFTESDVEPGKPTLSMDEVIGFYTADLPCPVVTDLAYGHFPRKVTLPVGVRARLTAEPGDVSLTLLEPVTE